MIARTLRLSTLAVVAASILASLGHVPLQAAGTTPVLGDLIFNEYAADNTAGGNDFVELLTLTDHLDLRGLRISDNELLAAGGALNNNEMVITFGNEAYLSDVPKGTTIAVYTTVADIVPDTTVNASASDWKLVLAPGSGISLSVDGLGGGLNPGYANGGDALYLFLPGPDGTSAGTDNIYFDFISWEGDGNAVAPTGLTDINLTAEADNAYYVGNTVAGNDLVANWIKAAALGAETPGDANPAQDLSALRVVPALPDLTISLADAPDPVLTGGMLTYTMQVTASGADATAISATLTLPPSGVAFDSAGSSHGFTGLHSAGIVTFSGGALATGQSATLTVNVVATGLSGVLTSGDAVVDPSDTIDESNDANNTAPGVTTVVQDMPNAPPTISAIGPLSGAIDDPTNPSASFTIADAETLAASLTVSATVTTNVGVAPLPNVSFGGSDGTRTVAVDPAGVGYASITITVTDGGGLETSSVLQYAASAASLTPVTTRFHTGASDASTAIAVDADYMLVADDEDEVLRLFSRHASGLPVKTFDVRSNLDLPDAREVDIEASTMAGSRIYWLGSHSNGSEGQIRPSRYRLFATDLSNPGSDADLGYVGRYDHLRADLLAWDATNGHGLGADHFGFALGTPSGTAPEQPNGAGFNIEGLVIAPDGTTGYLAFRAPLSPAAHRASALIVPVQNIDLLLAADGGTAGSALFGTPILLELGGRAIRSIDRNAAGDYLIVAGPTAYSTGAAPLDFRLFTWTGSAGDAPVLRSADLTSLATLGSFEGIVEVPAGLASATTLQVLSDNGDTVFYGDGTIAKDLIEVNFKKFRSDLVVLGSELPAEGVPAEGSVPMVGDIIINEFQSDNGPGSNDFLELLVLRDNLDLRGLRLTDNELAGGVLNQNESVLTFGTDAYLTNVPRGTVIAVWTLAAGITTDSVVNPAVNDWTLVLAPGTGVTASTDGLGGATNLGLATGGDGLYLYLPGPNGDSSGTDNVYLDFISWEAGATGPPGLVHIDLPSQADNSYFVECTAGGNDVVANWVRLDALGSQTPGTLNPGQEACGLQVASGAAAVLVTESGGSTDVAEGGSSDSFTVALSTAPAGAVQVDALADGQTEVSLDGTTFTSSVSIVLTSMTPTTVFVRAVDDGAVEGPHAGLITQTVVLSADPAYSDGLTPAPDVPVTITDNDIAITSIAEIQGPGAVSPLAGLSVTTRGIVTGVKTNGFFIQTPDAEVDGSPNTSEGIFVFTSSAPTVTLGNGVQVTGTVSEFIPSADPSQPPLTELTFATTSLLSPVNPLPATTTITAAMTTAVNAVELLERLEGMRVAVPSMTVVAPTLGSVNEPNATASSSGVFYGVVTGVARPFREAGIDVNEPLPPGSPCCVPRFDGNPERLRVDSDALGGAVLNLTVGVTVTGMTGPLDYGFRTYTVLPDAGSAAPATPNSTAAALAMPKVDEITVAGWNMFRFFDTVDDPGGEPVLTAAAFERRLTKASLAIRTILRSPDVIGVIEMENISTLQALATRLNDDTVAAGGANPNYTAHLVEGNDIGGIDVGFLVKSGRITALGVTQEGDAATFVDPTDGSIDLLNDRPPLVLSARAIRPNGSVFDFMVINNHLRSLNDVNDATTGPRVRAKRRAQAEFLADLIQDMQTTNPGVKVLAIGDFNAFEVNDGYVDGISTIVGAPTVADQVVLASADLVNPNLTNLLTLLSAGERYSYSFDGNAQVLDHALASAALMPWVSRFTYSRMGADYPEVVYNDQTRPERLSDHEATVTYVALGAPKLAGVIVAKTPRASGQVTITLRLSNTGGGNARNVAINPLVFRTLAGSGTVTSATPVSINVGDIPAGQFRDVTIVLNVPASVTRFSTTETVTNTDSAGAGYKTSMTQSVIP